MYSSANSQSSYEKFSQETPTGVPVSTSNTYFSDSSNYTNSGTAVSHSQLETKRRDPWSTGLCDCFSDCKNCCVTFWCPCITFGQVAEIVDKGSSSCGVNGALYTLIACVTGCACCYSCFYRTKMRQQYMLRKDPCGDCLVHFFCEYCALCQEYRELKSRGFDMSIGWHGNVEKKNRNLEMATIPPVVEEGMTK